MWSDPIWSDALRVINKLRVHQSFNVRRTRVRQFRLRCFTIVTNIALLTASAWAVLQQSSRHSYNTSPEHVALPIDRSHVHVHQHRPFRCRLPAPPAISRSHCSTHSHSASGPMSAATPPAAPTLLTQSQPQTQQETSSPQSPACAQSVASRRSRKLGKGGFRRLFSSKRIPDALPVALKIISFTN